MHRAKSTSSASSLYHQRSSQFTDPFVTRHHAEVAAIEAYSRPRHFDNARPALNRRGSQKTGRSEGSHFEDHRLARRGPSKRANATSNISKDQSSTNRLQRRSLQYLQPSRHLQPAYESVYSGQQHSQSGDSDDVEHKVITKRRSVIPPTASSSAQISSQLDSDRLCVPSTSDTHRARAPSLTDDNGSPAPRRTSLPSTAFQRSDVYDLASSPEQFSDFGGGVEPELHDGRRCATSKHQEQMTNPSQAMTRDKVLQDFQQQSKVRGRRSFIFGTLKRGGAASAKPTFDNTLPPFNCTDQINAMSFESPKAIPDIVPQLDVRKGGSKARNFTSTVKECFGKVFRASSRRPSGMPPQQVEAKSDHYLSTNTPVPKVTIQDDISPSGGDLCEDEIRGVDATQSGLIGDEPYRADSRLSHTQLSTTDRSRITSWTNSTVAGTATTRYPSDAIPSGPMTVDEHGLLKRTDSMATLRKAGSMLSRRLSSCARRQSRQYLGGPEESQGLYAVLKERIRPSQSHTESDPHEEIKGGNTENDNATNQNSLPLQSPLRSKISALSSLPSQQRPPSSRSTAPPWSAQTIRSVTPEAAATISKAKGREFLSPVNEMLSPSAASLSAELCETTPRSIDTQQSNLRRRGATKLKSSPRQRIALSSDQIARRVERDKNRWQTPLDATDGELPLQGLNHTITSVANNSYELPHHARVNQDQAAIDGRHVLSPSIYSRATDGASPRPETPAVASGTLITITGREVMRYDLSPPKQRSKVQSREPSSQKPLQASSDWRRWFSREMKGLSQSEKVEEFSLGMNPSSKAHGSALLKAEAPIVVPTAPTRPRESSGQSSRLSSRHSSYMNERYPMIVNGSSESVSTKQRRASSYIADRTSSSEMSSSRKSVVVQNRRSLPTPRSGESNGGTNTTHNLDTVGNIEPNGTAPHRTVTEQHHDTVTDAHMRSTTALQSQVELRKPSSISHLSNRPASATGQHPRSAFELRARYRNSTAASTRAIDIRRTNKPAIESMRSPQNAIQLEEDNTIRRISQGPYAESTITSTALQGEALGLAAKKSTRSMLKENTLPSPPSSEWLAAPAGHGGVAGKDIKVGTRCSPVAKEMYVPKARDSTSADCCSIASPAQPRSSPAQRMVTEWLGEKKLKECSSPAFV